MKRIFSFIMMLTAVFSVAVANDGVYFTSGNFLVPTKETDISVQKEILTITVGKDSMATVDVYYEFMNHGDAKTVTMAFEADAPYNACAKFCQNGVHPNIKDFTVTMNNQPLTYANKVVAIDYVDGKRQVDFTPLDMTKWKGWGQVPSSKLPMDDALYNAELDSTISFAYGYFFTAPFKPGMNVVHHTYSFLMSYRVGEKFVIPYWLTPATRWANHQIDDFTLRIKNKKPMQAFCMADSIFADAPFRIVNSNGEVPQKGLEHGSFYQLTVPSGGHYLFADLDDGAVLEWHKTNFCPKAEMEICDAEHILNTHCLSAPVAITADGMEYLYIGDCGDSYFVSSQEYSTIPKKDCKIVEYSVDNGQGWVYPRDFGTFNVRKGPSKKSPVIGKMKYVKGMLPDPCPCLGNAQTKEKDGWGWWYKIKFGNRVGYVLSDNMEWEAINAF